MIHPNTPLHELTGEEYPLGQYFHTYFVFESRICYRPHDRSVYFPAFREENGVHYDGFRAVSVPESVKTFGEMILFLARTENLIPNLPEPLKLLRAAEKESMCFYSTPVILGRSPTCSISFRDNRYVSRNHAEFFYESGQWHIRDLDSRNRTYLNGTALNPFEATALREGDMITLAKQEETTLVFISG